MSPTIIDSTSNLPGTHFDTIDSIFFPHIYHSNPITHYPINPFTQYSTTSSSTTPSTHTPASTTSTTPSPSTSISVPTHSAKSLPHPNPSTTLTESDIARKASLQALQQEATARAQTAATQGLRRSARISQPSAPYLESIAHPITASSGNSSCFLTYELPPVPSLAKYREDGNSACPSLPGAHGGSFVSTVVPPDAVLDFAESPSSSVVVHPVYDSSNSVLFTLDATCTLSSHPTPCISLEPTTVQQALSGKYASYWRDAMQEELASLVSHGVWSSVPRIPGTRTVRTRWLFKIKRHLDGSIDKFRARLVARGFSQKPGIDVNETFASIVRHKSWRLLVALAANNNHVLLHWDIKTAFLNANLSQPIYIEPPEGFSTSSNTVYLLHKGLYGLKQASREWFNELSSTFYSLNFVACPQDPSVFLYFNPPTTLLIAVAIWVDDLLVYAPDNPNLIHKLKQQLQLKYTIHDKGSLAEFLGIRITRNSVKQTIKLDQTDYIKSILSRFNLSNANPVPTPGVPEVKLTISDCPSTDEDRTTMSSIPYQAAVGCLLYLAVCTRPDIAACVSNVARFMHNPGKKHWEAVKRIFRYLRGTPEYGLVFTGKHPSISFYAESDATWASTDPDTYRSVTGYVTFLNGTPISWRSIKQRVVALSSTEAEYISAAACAREIHWVRNFLLTLHMPLTQPTVLYCDNRGCIDLSINPVNHERNKHINIKYHYIKYAYEHQILVLVFKPSSDLVADLLTKSIRPPRFDSLRYHLVRID